MNGSPKSADPVRLDTAQLKESCSALRCGDRVLLSGTVYTARDAAHKRIFELLDSSSPLPFELDGAVIYYAGPTPAPEGRAVGSCGPTTSSRMDAYTPRLMSLGLKATIGKGERSEEVYRAVQKYSGVYFCATGGAGALLSRHIRSAEVIAFPELGCEAVRKLTVFELPLTVAADSRGGIIFERQAE
ncbi:MAG: FumA C-terminus/TtdB family hydratase beta subunit [Oscillospiraceae bacterium]|nr:FumA C-terminus/TtdB family hydratase beta subunit [Oscillospiraceae bacterium]